jgi:hypothetical protein
MPRKKADAPDTEGATPAAPQWTHSQLLAVKHLGPAIIGQAMHSAAQQFEKDTKGGIFGPALLATE